MASRTTLLLGATLVFGFVPASHGAAAEKMLFEDDFSGPRLTHWVTTSKNDFNESVAERSEDGRLRLRADTMGTRDDSVKYLGVRLRDGYDVRPGLCVAVTLDWNDQANGSYLTAAVVLAENEIDTHPWDSPDWISVEYVGVPPGRNTRMQLREGARGQVRVLEDEGWPEEQRTGREVGEVRVRIDLAPERLRVWENEELKYQRAEGVRLSRAVLYLQLASHSNYRAREVYFDDVAVRRGPCSEPNPIEPPSPSR